MLGLGLTAWLLTGEWNPSPEEYQAAVRTEYKDATPSFEAGRKVFIGSVSFFENFASLIYDYGSMNYAGQTPANNRALALIQAGKEDRLLGLVLEGLRQQGRRLAEGDPLAIGELVTSAAVATDVSSKVSVATKSLSLPVGLEASLDSVATVSVATTTVAVPSIAGAGTAAAAGGGYLMMMAGGGFGEYRDVKGHHIHAQAGFKGHVTYDPRRGFSISKEYMKSRGWSHEAMTVKQRQLFDELARSGRPNTLEEHTRIAIEALKAGNAPESEALKLVGESLRNLEMQGVKAPTHIPWN